jgi:hypothetical protein
MNWCGRPLLHAPIAYGLCLSQQEFDKACDKLGCKRGPFLPDNATAATHFIQANDKWRLVVCIKPSRKSLEHIYAALVHEAVHVWQQIRAHIGESRAGDEQEAYCIERISFNLMQSYKKQTGER